MSIEEVQEVQKQPSQRLFIAIGVLWLILGAVIFWQIPTAVSTIRINWETETETDTAGFNIYRAPAPAGAAANEDCASVAFDSYQQINNQLISSSGDAVSGAAYSFEDRTAEVDRRYCYQLEDVERSGRTERHDPIFGSSPGQFNRILYIVLAPLSLIVGLALIISGFRARNQL